MQPFTKVTADFRAGVSDNRDDARCNLQSEAAEAAIWINRRTEGAAGTSIVW